MAKIDFAALETSVLDFWHKNQVFETLVRENADRPPWTLLDGPVTANGRLGVHHGWGRTYKDVYNRYHAMNGKRLSWQQGFDCHGLWVEVEVEKELRLHDKRDILHYGVNRFTQKCRERVEHFSGIITEQSKRLGQWNHWDKSYFTHSDENILAIWRFLKICHERGLLYQGRKVLPWCPRCGCSLSQHEVSDSYASATDQSIIFAVQLKNTDERLLIWTTTPWTVSANRAAAVHPEANYVSFSDENKIYWVSERSLDGHFNDKKRLLFCKGSDLVGMEYFHPLTGAVYKVIPWTDILPEEGTGIVHIAPGCGAEDYELGERHNLEAYCPVDGNGCCPNDKGMKYQDVNDQVCRALGDKLYKQYDHEHRVTFCWRCNSRLINRLCDEWFLSVDSIRSQLKEAAAKVNWTPAYSGELMQNWLDQMGDWCISRRRFWGLPLPFYFCDDRHLTVTDQKPCEDLHRPAIDEQKISCGTCGKKANRIPEVGDCWLDAGIVPFSTHAFPADFAAEMREQVRLWFYSSLLMSVVLDGKAPWRSVMTYEDMRDAHGKAFSKTKSNSISLDEAIARHGADSLRYVYSTAPLNQPLRFSEKAIEDCKRKLLTIYNCREFYTGYTKTINVATGWHHPILDIDKWICARLQELIRDFRSGLDKYNVSSSMHTFEAFVEDLSNWYIRVKRPYLAGSANAREKSTHLNILGYVLTTLAKVIAPVLPFTAENLYLATNSSPDIKSVHLHSYPQVNAQLVNPKLISEMALLRKIVRSVLAIRVEKGIKLRQPLQQLYLQAEESDAMLRMARIITAECNVHEVIVVSALPPGNEFWYNSVTDDFSVSVNVELTEDLISEGAARDFIRCVQNIRKEAGLSPADRIDIVCNTFPDELRTHKNMILERCSADDVIENATKIAQQGAVVKINDKDCCVGIVKEK